MKYRTGFVSNSSSTSFTCDITGRTESGYDMGLEEIGMFECQAGHTFDEDCIDLDDVRKDLRPEATKIFHNEYAKDNEFSETFIDDIVHDLMGDYRYDLPEKFCPICQMKNFTHRDLRRFFIAYRAEQSGVSKEEAEQLLYEDIRNKFKSYQEFKEFLK